MAVILALVPAIEAQPQTAPGADVAITRTRAGLIAAEVVLADVPVRAALDTGASVTLVSAALATRLGLVAAARSSVTDAGGGERPLLLAATVEIHWGGVRARLPWVGWVPGTVGLEGASGLDAVLGADALATADVLVDARRGRLRVAPAGSLAAWIDGDAVPLRAIEGRPALDVEVGNLGAGNSPLPLVVDSGADVTVLFGAAAAAALAQRGGGRALGMDTAGGTVQVAPVRLGRARAGATSWRIGRAAAIPQVRDRSEAGLVPLDALGSLRLDMASGNAVLSAVLRDRPR